jgi:hypothetical protein
MAAFGAAALTAAVLAGNALPASAGQIEVSRLHPITRDNKHTDTRMTLVKYYNTNNGEYRGCITSYHDPLHVGSFFASVVWYSSTVSDDEIRLPANGKTNCSPWRALHMKGMNANYNFGGKTWQGILYK